MREKNAKLYDKFRNSSLDTSSIGMIPGSERSFSELTPSGARVFAWAVLGSAHFCTVGEFDETVFAVNPDAPESLEVHPVAESIQALFGLIIACKGVELIWSASRYSRVEFETALAAQKPGAKQQSVLRALGNIYHPPIISDPYGYMEFLRRK